MLKILKLGAASLLVLSLLLPMSSCGVSQLRGETTGAQHTEIVQVHRYIVSGENTWLDGLYVLNFFAPLLLALFALQTSPGLLQLLLQTIAPAPALMVIWVHAITGDLAVGGYLALLCALGYLGLSVGELADKGVHRMGFKSAPP